jgi:hypothetical protein
MHELALEDSHFTHVNHPASFLIADLLLFSVADPDYGLPIGVL